jgi:excisionase family DNA binding protein
LEFSKGIAVMQRRLIKIKEAATVLDVSEDRAYQMAREGLLPIVHLGRQVRVDSDRLEEWILQGGKSHERGWRK